MNKKIRGVGDLSACGGCWSLPEGSKERLWYEGSSGYKSSYELNCGKMCSSCPGSRI